MFGKTSKLVGSVVSNAAAATAVPSIIGPEMSVRGDLHSDGDLHVDGTVQGDIRVKRLVIGKDATVRGDIEAASVRIAGSVSGTVRAREVILTASAKMLGDVYQEILSVEPGAMIEGHCRRLDAVKATDAALALTSTAAVEPDRLTLQAPAPGSTH